MKSKGSYWILIIGFIVNVFLALTPFIPHVKDLWRVDDPRQFYAVLATFMGVDMALVTLVFGVLFVRESTGFRNEITAIAERVPPSTIRWVQDRDFYRTFLGASTEAVHTVRISYFSPDPPNAVNDADRNDYYRRMKRTMKRRSDVRFFRLVRYTPANRDWLLEMVRDFDGHPNVNLAVLSSDLEPERVMPLALSVQIVDQKKAWLVAVEAHERLGQFRDLYIENDALAGALDRYHQRLWTLSEPILLDGRPTDAAQAIANDEYGR
jgi:hypothetical protein